MYPSQKKIPTNYQPFISLIQKGNLQEAESALLLAISKSPIDAQLWVMLGETLLLQKETTSAQRVLERAWLLDPQAQWVASMFENIGKLPATPVQPHIAELLQVPQVTVAAGILTYNESANIAKCIAALQSAVDEILVIDSSTDNTAQIAAQFPKVKVIRITWSDDFAAARNIGLVHIQSDWVLWVDADEALLPADVPAVREVAGIFHSLPVPAALHVWHLNRVNGAVRHDFSQVRMFPAQRGLRYYGRIHEQVGTAAGVFQDDTYRRAVRIRLDHNGYEPSVVQSRGKLERNLRLLAQMVHDEPNNPGHLLFLGRELLAAKREEEALTVLLEAERTARQTPLFGRLSEVYRLLIQIKLKQKQIDEAEAYCRLLIADSPDFPDGHYLLAQIKMQQANALMQEAEKELKQALQVLPQYRGSVSPDYQIAEWKAAAALGEIAHRSGKLAKAKEVWSKVQQVPGSSERVLRKLEDIEAERRKLNDSAQ
ncbi:glycosyltransferase [Paenibacillus oryzisoli]|uniref:glycosyltransferase n=1 Tax=Paenibacillus oryzisoli TaxID=1850517 RepID=UPI003D2E5E1B